MLSPPPSNRIGGLEVEPRFSFPEYDRDVVFVAIGRGQSGKSYLLNSILATTEQRGKPSFYMDVLRELSGNVRGRRVVRTFEEFRHALSVDSAYFKAPTTGTIVFQPSEYLLMSRDSTEIFDMTLTLLDWWSERLRDSFPDGSRKLSIFFPELKEFTSSNFAPHKLRRLATAGRHKFRIFYATQSAIGQPSDIIGNCNILCTFAAHMPSHVKRMEEIHPYFSDIDQLPEFTFKMVDLGRRTAYVGRIGS